MQKHNLLGGDTKELETTKKPFRSNRCLRKKKQITDRLADDIILPAVSPSVPRVLPRVSAYWAAYDANNDVSWPSASLRYSDVLSLHNKHL